MNSIETEVLRLIGENTSSPDVFTEGSAQLDLIRGSVNDAIEEINMITGAIVRTYKQPIRANAPFYWIQMVKDNVNWVTNIWLRGVERKLERVGLFGLVRDNPRWLYNGGSPTVYFTVGDNVIGIHPVPSSDSGMLEITCSVVPDRYTLDTDRVKLREQYNHAAVYFAVGEYYASRGDAKRALKWHRKYTETVGLNVVYPSKADRYWQMATVKNPSQGIAEGKII